MDLSRAEVSIESGGVSLEVDVSELEASPGSESAIRIVPRGWSVQAGETYAVRVRKVRPKIEYEVTIVDCAG